MKKLQYILLLALSVGMYGQGYLHQQGQDVVDGDGNPVLLRGLGLGGWMIQEGYMLQTSAFAGPQHEIRQKITELIGEENTETFYQAYRDNGVTKRDIDSLKAWGFNSVRLPMHYNLYTLPIEDEPVPGENTWLEEGFERTDLLLQWCAENEMYLILDMHGAPGGQGKDANISDYDDSKPSLWESQANKDKMIALWKELADRYKDEPWIGGYDLINEPNWAFTGTNQNGCDENDNGPLRELMIDITEAIREVDANHIIIIEGNCWGNNYNGIFPLWDDNMVVSFHKYWNSNTLGAIQGIINHRTNNNVPIWLGETGENSNVWFRDAIKLIEENNIGWAWWPMKKVESIAGVTNVTKPADYQTLLNYWTNGGTQPTAEFATAALMELAENYKMENVTVKPDVIDAMFRQPHSDETLPYVNHQLPGKLYATTFDLGTNGQAYFDNDVATYHTDTGTYQAWNQGWAMRNDGVDVEVSNDVADEGDFMVGFIEAGEWLQFTIEREQAKAYDIDIRYAGGGSLHLEDENGWISEQVTLANTGNFTTWSTATLTDIVIPAGTTKLRLYFDTDGFNLNYLDFKNERPTGEAIFKVVDAATTILGDKVIVTFNKQLAADIEFNDANLILKVNNTEVTIEEVGIIEGVSNAFYILPATGINASDVVTLTYTGTIITADDATTLPEFTDKLVANRVGNVHTISGIIQAEDFYANNGLQLENTSDAGGGQNIGYTDAGDYLDYLVNISPAGEYKIEFRTSGESQTGGIKLQLLTESGIQDIQTASLNPTGNWQTWQTVTTEANLPAGRYIMRVLITAPGFNFNWMKFSYLAPDDDNDGVSNENDLCPETPEGAVVDFNGCTLFVLPANNFAVQVSSETCRSANNGSIGITVTENYNYIATLTGATGNDTTEFTSNAAFEGLEAGTYTLCITIAESTSFQQCYDLVVTEPSDLAVYARMFMEEGAVELDLFGAENYHVTLNGDTFTTSQNVVRLDLKPGENNIMVRTDKECQGIFSRKIMMDNTITIHPNPVNAGIAYINIPDARETNATVEIFSLDGKKIAANQYQVENRMFSVDMNAFSAGMYMIRISAGASVLNTKIIKE